LEEIVGVVRSIEIKAKLSKINSGENNPMFGKPAPQGSGNGWSGWYNGWFFRSILELSYMIKVIERYSMKWETGENHKYKIPYTDTYGVCRNYFPDFIINDKYIVEIKPNRLIKTLKVIEKINAGIEYCNTNNMIYKITNIPPLTNYEFKCLIETKKVDISYIIKAISGILALNQTTFRIIIESTISTSTIKELKLKFHNIDKELHFIHAPERILPGDTFNELINNDRLIGSDESNYAI
jgi:hypothetical protein